MQSSENYWVFFSFSLVIKNSRLTREDALVPEQMEKEGEGATG